MEPGKADFARLTISMRPEEEAQFLELKHKLEAKAGKRLTVSEIFRQGISCLRNREGLA
jgi:hypothetical protein